mmetsp:Transcript_28438/g.33651  ORF Transcript_28438/g.33651 Transcript_28438/m.33651 type:complete len:87 (+) Transcript_28438:711-971(+)
MKNTSLYVVNGLLMTVLWFIFRILMFAWLGYRIYKSKDALMTLSTFKIIAILITYIVGYALQIFWFSKIFKGALKVLRSQNNNKKK